MESDEGSGFEMASRCEFGRQRVWVLPAAGGTPTRVTFTAGDGQSGVLFANDQQSGDVLDHGHYSYSVSADGRFVAFQSSANDLTPINTGSTCASEPGNEPTSRAFAHVVGMAFPDLGLGEPRFPSRDRAEASFMLAPVSVTPGRYRKEERGHEAFATSTDPRGRDVGRDGPFLCKNTGPRDNGAAPTPGISTASTGRSASSKSSVQAARRLSSHGPRPPGPWR